jgi:hypothetical protein
MTVRPPSADYKLPALVTKCRRALEQEGKGLKTALDEYASSTPATGCQWEADVATARRAGNHASAAQQRLLQWTQHQARLIYINAYDHLTSMGRLLGSDGAMSLYAHVTVSRSVCESGRRRGILDAVMRDHVAVTVIAICPWERYLSRFLVRAVFGSC